MVGQWQDGCDGENKDRAVMDDFCGWLLFCDLLWLTEHYPHKVPLNGIPTFVEFTSKKIIMTSNKMPDQWCGEPFNMRALYRMILVQKDQPSVPCGEQWNKKHATGYVQANIHPEENIQKSHLGLGTGNGICYNVLHFGGEGGPYGSTGLMRPGLN